MSQLKQYINRSAQILQDNVSRIMGMTGADGPSRLPRTLFTFNSEGDLKQFATGCDADIGGLSTSNFDLNVSAQRNAAIGRSVTAKFWGDMRLEVKPGFEGRLRGGYAGFRNKTRPTLFGNMLEDMSNHKYLALRVLVAGEPRTRNSYFVNIQTDGPITTDLWQHRLYFQRHDESWEDVFVPLHCFVRTNSGEMSLYQIKMCSEKVKSVGISILGGNSGSGGRYELGIDSIRIVNDEEVFRTLPGKALPTI